MSFSRFTLALMLILVLLQFSSTAYAISEEERNFLLMYFKEEEIQVISATRSLQSISRIAENVEVVTARDIELMNAHTLADVLNTVNGVTVQFFGASPGSLAAVSIQGSAAEQVVVFIDGIAINYILSDQAGEIASIPVQMIDKIEVIKGPASSVWGSSLGGVINIITKSPPKKEGVNGTFSASYGKQNTGDFRAEMAGRKNDFGFYLYAGRLQTDGLRPQEEISFNNLYAKFTYDVTSKTTAGLTLFYDKGDRQEGDFSALDFSVKDRTENFFATFNLNSSLSEGVDLNISLRAARQRFDSDLTILSTGESSTTPFDDRKYGGTAKLTWKSGMHNIVVGSDYDYKKEISPLYLGATPSLNVFAVYVNDTISIKKFSITPGIRYDHTDRNEDFTSPSLGMTYEIADKTLFRAAVARGFHLPNLGATVADRLFFVHNPDLKPEKVWSYQAGIESGLLNYAWLKLTAFRYDIKDAIVSETLPDDKETVINAGKVRRQGVEGELRSRKLYNFTFSAGAMYSNSKDLISGEKVHGLPDYVYDVSLKYDDERSFRALLKGRYAWLQSIGGTNPKSDFIFDLNLIKTIIRKENRILEAYVAGHNIFNGSQYWDELYKNAARWVEAGVRYKF